MPTLSFTEDEIKDLAQRIGRYLHLAPEAAPVPPQDGPGEAEPPEPAPTPEPALEPPTRPPTAPQPPVPDGELRGTLTKSYHWNRLADWNGVSAPGNVASEAVREVMDPKGIYGTVLQFRNKAGAERAEVKATPNPGQIPHGAPYYAALSVLLDTSYPIIPAGSGYMIIWQLHGVADKLSPAMSIRTDSRGIVLRCRGGSDDNTKEEFVISKDHHKGTWQHIVIAATASDSPAPVKVWHRVEGGQWRLAVSGRGHTAASHKNGQYYRAGEYGKPPSEALLWQTNHALGNSFDEVAP